MSYLISLIIIFSILINPINAYAAEVILAGSCFWCLEHDLESFKGVNKVLSGYSGGDLPNPTYENHEGHQEVVLVKYDSKVINSSSDASIGLILLSFSFSSTVSFSNSLFFVSTIGAVVVIVFCFFCSGLQS